jgi:hypothetical protein
MDKPLLDLLLDCDNIRNSRYSSVLGGDVSVCGKSRYVVFYEDRYYGNRALQLAKELEKDGFMKWHHQDSVNLSIRQHFAITKKGQDFIESYKRFQTL